MIGRQPANRVESEDEHAEPAYCAMLDEHWEDLQRRPESDAGRRPIDRDRLDSSLARDLEILDRLHRLQQSGRASDDGSQERTVWASEPFDPDSESQARDPDRAERLIAFLDVEAHTQSLGVAGDGWRGAGVKPRTQPRDPEQLTTDHGPRTNGTMPSRRIGKYPVIEMLDEGGQAQIFRVLHPELGKDFVLKLARRPTELGVASQADTPVRDRMRLEGQTLAQCDHPNLVRVVDLDVHEGRPFIVMEYVPGLTLERFVDQNRPGPRQAARLVAELSRAVAYLHARGIIHQDIKPRNVLIDAQGRPRLIDFGLVRLRGAWSGDTTHWTGGTAAFMSPEQAANRSDAIGPCTDVFGLGGLLYYFLTGRPLYRGLSHLSVLRQAIGAEYLPVRRVNRRAPRSLERIAHKALAADPERRYRTAVELEHALRRFLMRRRIMQAGLIAACLLAIAPIVHRATAPRAEPSVNIPTLVTPPRIASFQVDQFRGEPSRAIGPIGLSARAILVDDDVRVSVQLAAPAYCYLIALESDGDVQPCHPTAADEPPRPSAEIHFPPGASTFFGLTDGPGLQAFAVVTSRQPLPPYEKWIGRDGLKARWKPVAADGAWRYDDRGFTRIAGVPRGELRERSGSGPPAPFRAVCEYLEELPGVDAIQAIAFPVRSKD